MKTDLQITHAPGCWGWGQEHYECAVGQVERDEALLRQALEQPEALRLADHLERFRSFPDDLAAAAELRRLHTENEAKDALLRQALYVIEAWERGCDKSDYWRDRDDAIAALRTRLEGKT